MDIDGGMRRPVVFIVLSLALKAMAQVPMPLDADNSLEALMLRESVLKSEWLDIAPDTLPCRHQGLGKMTYDSSRQLTLSVPASTGMRAQGPPGDPDYATYGRATVSYLLNGRNLEEFDRITMDVFPQCEGTAIMNLNISVNNSPQSDLGAHLVNLKNNQWNRVVYDISGINRDKVNAIDIYTDLKGRNQARCDSFVYHIANIRFQQVAHNFSETGWLPQPKLMAYPTSGYFAQGTKTAVIRLPESPGNQPINSSNRFALVDDLSGDTVFTGVVEAKATTIGTFGVLDFSSFTKAGDYRLECMGMLTDAFHIGDKVFRHAEQLLLNFIYCQRCGHEVPGIHGACHNDVFCDFNGKQVAYGGGWHDAGDLSQQTLQTCETAYALLEMWDKTHDKTSELARRLLEESAWGLRFVLRCRLGNGYHASSIGLLHWTDGIAGTDDDIHTVRRQNMAYDNFIYAACEAFAARTLPASTLRDSLEKASVEDFHFAMSKFQREGYDVFPHIMEHTYNTSHSQFQATMSWAASQLFMLTGKKEYGEIAANSIRYVMECQETQGACPGFIYRDTTRRAIVHYIHQSRQQLFIQALVDLCESQPEHKEYGRWLQCIKSYGTYLKKIQHYTEPYGMAPSGIYKTEEYADSAGFHALHIFSPENAHERYDVQLRKGERIDSRFYLRRFPIWFGIFNGNEAVILAAGKAAAICGRFLNDDELLQIGREQLYWTVGKNPFCQSLIYGEGYRYPSQDSFSSGEIMGEIPVGIRSWENDDIPYWPHTNNACYKEVWVTSAAKFLSLLAEFENN